MKPCHSIAIAAVVASILTWPGRGIAQETADYFISNYELTASLRAGTADVHVTMDLTYHISSGTKSEGFKYIGNFRATGLRGIDDEGNALQTSVKQERETRIQWQFRPAGPGEKRVRISFVMPDALSGDLAQNVFEAEWAGVFKVPVRSAMYRLILPSGWSEDSIDVSPSSFTREIYEGRRAIDVIQTPLRDRRFAVTFRPGVSQAGVRPFDLFNKQRVAERTFGILLVFGVFVWMVAAAARANRGASRQSSGSSSCAGGSSCSSGCGGGGCGGGCGG